MESRRKKLFKTYELVLKMNNPPMGTSSGEVRNENEFLNLFSSENATKVVFKYFKTVGLPLKDSQNNEITLEQFYKLYCCDLEWAKNNIEVCKSTSQSGGQTQEKPTVKPQEKPTVKPEEKPSIQTEPKPEKSFFQSIEWEPVKEQKNQNKNTILKEQEELSDKEFWDVVLKNCFPDWFIPKELTRDKKNPNRVVYVGQHRTSGVEYYWFRKPMVVMNGQTGIEKPWNCEGITNYKVKKTQTDLFQMFGINPNQMEDEEIKSVIENLTNKLQGYINKGAVSTIFNRWNKMLNQYYPESTKLTPKEGGSLTLTLGQSELNTNYYPENFDTEGWNNVVIYFKKGTNKGLSKVEKTTLTDDECKDYMISYLTATLEWSPGTTVIPQVLEYQKWIKSCARAGKYKVLKLTKDDLPELDKKLQVVKTGPLSKWFKSLRELNFREIVDLLAGKKDVIKPNSGNPYLFNLNIQESKIKNIIKLSLNEVKENKLKNTVVENIVRNRTFVLMESTNLSDKKNQIKLVDNLIKESFFLETQEFNKQIIKEEFWDVLSGFFGRENSEEIFKTFKERMGDWLVLHLSPRKQDGWIPKAIKRAVNDIQLRDVEKITDCKFLTKKVTESIIESLNKKMLKGEKSDNGLYDVIRDGMTYDVNNPRFKDELKFKVSKMICPLIARVSSELDRTFEKMRERAMKA